MFRAITNCGLIAAPLYFEEGDVDFVYDPEGEIVRAIFSAWEKKQSSENRPHLGCSIIGRKCAREIWYNFRWVSPPKFEGRILRLFDRGQREEPTIVRELKMIGCEVWEVDPQTREQFRVSFGSGYIGGSVDGVARGIPGAPKTPHLLEFKTHNDKSFRNLEAKGLEKSKPEHMAQMQCYMKGLKLTRGLYMAVNKNSDHLYTERVKFDKTMAQEAIDRGVDIVRSSVPPPRISNRPDWYECKWCQFSPQCHSGKPMAKNCRTCKHAQLPGDGKWVCGLTSETRNVEAQRMGCEKWSPI